MKAKRVDLTVSISVSVFAPLEVPDERIRNLVEDYMEVLDLPPVLGYTFKADVADTGEDQDTKWLDMTDALCLSDDREELVNSSEATWWRDGE